MDSVSILSVPIHQITKTATLELVEQFIASGQPHQITTVNNEFILDAQSNAQFLKALQSADLSLADSTGAVWAANRTGGKVERIPGADLVNDLARTGAGRWSLYLAGGQDGVAEQAGKQLQKLYPGLNIVGSEVGLAPGETDVKPLINRIKAAKPDILLVAFGAPKQELFIYDNKQELGVPVMIGVGGTLDFLAGKISRAPQFIRSLGLEWLWRLIQQPSRLPRIFRALIIFPLRVLIGK